MKKSKTTLIFTLLSSLSITIALVLMPSIGQSQKKSKDLVSEAVRFAEKQYTSLVKTTKKAEKKARKEKGKKQLLYPRTKYDAKNEVRYERLGGWTMGFWPGALWHLESLTGKRKWGGLALKYTKYLDIVTTHSTHDLGFMINNSFGWAYYRKPKEEYKKSLITAAQTLTNRYNSKVKAMLSWKGHSAGNWQYAVIIDSFMNQELLLHVAQITGDNSYKEIALNHIKTVSDHIYRPDYTVYHVLDFDTNTGKNIGKATAQGYAKDSIWARGQAWGFYGNVMFYRYLKDKKYLERAEKAINTLLNHPNMPEDLVPYWDYKYPEIPNTARDTSAAAIMASALYELSTYAGEKSTFYKEKADKMLTALATKYRAKKVGDNYNFLITDATGHFMGKHEIAVPIIYADYYYLEALARKRALEKDGNLKKVLMGIKSYK